MHNILEKGGSIIGYSLLGIMIFLNVFSGIISGIWLIVLGLWPELLLGVIYSFVMPFAYTLVALPSMLLMPLLLRFSENGNKVMTAIFGFINVIYSDLIILFWTYFVFSEFVSGASGTAVIPLILWGYTVVIAPLGYMAKGEQDSIGTSLGIYFAQFSFVALIILWLAGATESTTYFVLGALILLFSMIPTVLTVLMINERTEATVTDDNLKEEVEEKIFASTIDAQIEDEHRVCTNCRKEVSAQAEYCRFCGFKK